MSKNRNKFEQASKKKHTLGALAANMHTKGDLKASAIETLKDVVVGIVAGGITGALIGKPSLGIGLAVTGLGHYKENRLISNFGLGMMAANGFQSGSNPVNGLGFIDSAKARLLNFKDSFSQKLYLDKIMKKKEDEEETNGVGDVKYFLYPAGEKENKELDLSALNMIEDQVVRSAMNHQKNSQSQIQSENTTEGTGEIILDPTRKNY